MCPILQHYMLITFRSSVSSVKSAWLLKTPKISTACKFSSLFPVPFQCLTPFIYSSIFKCQLTLWMIWWLHTWVAQRQNMGMYHNTFTPSLHLLSICQPCLVFVICGHRRVVEGSGVGSTAWACSAAWRSHVHCCNLLLSMANVASLTCGNCEFMSSAESVWHVTVSVTLCCC